MISIYGFGQPLGGFTQLQNGENPNLSLQRDNNHSFAVVKSSELTCNPFTSTQFYRYYKYTATYNTNFGFDLNSSANQFYFIVWKIGVGVQPEVIFDSGNEIPYTRSLERGQTQNPKGLRASSIENCENYNSTGADGYLADFRNGEQLKNGETIVIGVYGYNVTDTFSIDIHTIEQENLIKNTECAGGNYSLANVKTEIATKESITDLSLITFFTDENISNPRNEAAPVTTAETVYARIDDGSGDVKLIYKIDFSFRAVFDFIPVIKPVNERVISNCLPSISINENQFLGYIINVPDLSDFEIEDISYNDGSTLPNPFPNNTTIRIKVKYKGTDFCEKISDWITLEFKNANPTFDTSAIFQVNKCEPASISLTELENLLKVNTSNYKLNVIDYTPGQVITFNPSDQFVFQVQLEDINDASCKSNVENFTINKTFPINIIDETINTCLNELTQEDIDDKIDLILNGTSATLTYWENGVEILKNNLLNHIKTNLSGTITVIATLSNSCDTEKKLTYNLGQSSVNVSTINPLISSCLAANTSYKFTQAEIENYINTVLGISIDSFYFIDSDFTVSPNGSKTIKFQVKKSGETCWSDEFTIELKTVNEPDFDLSSIPNQIADCDDNLIINNQWLIDEFSTDVLNYDIVINGQNYTNNQIIPLDFSSSTTQNITIEIRNPNSASCSIVGSFIVEQKTQFTDDISTTQTWLNQEAQKIVFCEGNSPESQIQVLIDYINANHSNLTFNKTVSEIAQEMTQTNGTVQLTIFRVDECGEKFLTINYNKIDLPTLVLPSFDKICAGSLFVFDVSSFDPNFDYFITDSSGNTITPTANIFELVAGDYIMYATNSNGCRSVDYPFTITTFPDPIIKSVTIENGTLKIEAKNSSGGLLEYAITADGLIPNETDWQRKNEFTNIIQGINYTVWVRENGCGGISINNLYVLNLPNFISPNGDGINDVWRPIGTFNNDKTIRLQIFDRYGNTILSKEGVNDILLWDGKRNGYPVPTADYWYLVDYPQQNDNTTVINIKYSGNITVKNK